jgi:opacity protein-like surface antigen
MIERLRSRLPVVLVLVALATLPALPASGAELTAFAMGGKPGEVWGTGYGGMLTITLFTFANGELEGAWQGSVLPETSIVSGSAKAYLGIPLGPVVPYAGVGVGVYRESLPTRSDQGTSGMVFAGAKLKFPFGLVVRGEYQWLDMPDEVLQPLDNRYLIAAGLSF